MDAKSRVEEALVQGDTLPAGPAVIARLTELTCDESATARDLGKVLQLDPALTTRVLKQVNSPFYGLSQTINTVTQAVVILGFREIKSIAQTIPVADLFHANQGAGGIDIAAVWERSIEIACLGRTLSYAIEYPVPEEIFVAGILADTGMVILNRLLGDDYAAVVNSAEEAAMLPMCENDQLGITHAEVGYQLARKWRFPDELSRTIRYHHMPIPDGELQPGAGLLFLAQRIHRFYDSGGDMDLLIESLPEPFATYSLTPEALEEAYTTAKTEFEEARTRLAPE